MDATQKKTIPQRQNRALKLTLDALMLVLLALMYKTRVISLSFHEIGGLALIGLFVIHHLLNARWIVSAMRRLFATGTPGMVRARFIVDALLLVSFVTVGVTGVLINKTLLAIRVVGNAKTLHYFASAVSILLMGVHLGLHAGYLFGKAFRAGANRIAKSATALVLAAMIVFGGFSLATTQFVSFLSAPMQAELFSHGSFQSSGDAALDGGLGERPSDISQLPERSDDNAAQPPQDGESGFSGGAHGNGQGRGEGRAEGAGRGQSEGGFSNAALLVAQYASIITLFGAVTYGVVRLAGKRKRVTREERLQN